MNLLFKSDYTYSQWEELTKNKLTCISIRTEDDCYGGNAFYVKFIIEIKNENCCGFYNLCGVYATNEFLYDMIFGYANRDITSLLEVVAISNTKITYILK